MWLFKLLLLLGLIASWIPVESKTFDLVSKEITIDFESEEEQEEELEEEEVVV
jgi:hypothetical protein